MGTVWTSFMHFLQAAVDCLPAISAVDALSCVSQRILRANNPSQLLIVIVIHTTFYV